MLCPILHWGMNLSLIHEFDHLENTEHFQNVEFFIIEHETNDIS